MSVPTEDGVYWVRACSDGPWEAVLLRHGRCRTMYGERWDASETAVWGARIHEPDDEPPAPSPDALRERLQALVEAWRAYAERDELAAHWMRECARELAALLAETE